MQKVSSSTDEILPTPAAVALPTANPYTVTQAAKEAAMKASVSENSLGKTVAAILQQTSAPRDVPLTSRDVALTTRGPYSSRTRVAESPLTLGSSSRDDSWSDDISCDLASARAGCAQISERQPCVLRSHSWAPGIVQPGSMRPPSVAEAPRTVCPQDSHFFRRPLSPSRIRTEAQQRARTWTAAVVEHFSNVRDDTPTTDQGDDVEWFYPQQKVIHAGGFAAGRRTRAHGKADSTSVGAGDEALHADRGQGPFSKQGRPPLPRGRTVQRTQSWTPGVVREPAISWASGLPRTSLTPCRGRDASSRSSSRDLMQRLVASKAEAYAAALREGHSRSISATRERMVSPSQH